MKKILWIIGALLLLAACTHPSQSQTRTTPLPAIPTSTFQPTGHVLVDATTKYIDYNDADFKKAVDEGRVIYLEFSAAWCPECQRLDPIIRSSIETLNDPAVVGFKVDYDTGKELERQYNVIYQHTHIILARDGSISWKSMKSEWDDALFQQELKKAEAS